MRQLLPSKREKRKQPAYLATLAKLAEDKSSNTPIVYTQNTVFRPTYKQLEDAYHWELQRKDIPNIIDRYLALYECSNQKHKYTHLHNAVDVIYRAWHKQKGHCAITGLKLRGGPECLGYGIGFFVAKSKPIKRESDVLLVSYPLSTVMCRSHIIYPALYEPVRLEAELIANILSAIRLSPLLCNFGLTSRTRADSGDNRIDISALVPFEFRNVQDLPFWVITSPQPQTVMSIKFSRATQSIVMDGRKQREDSYGQSDSNKIEYSLSDPSVTPELLNNAAIDMIHESYIAKLTSSIMNMTRSAVLNPLDSRTVQDVWTPPSVRPRNNRRSLPVTDIPGWSKRMH